MWWKVKWLVLWSLWAARLVRQPTPPVLTTSGWVRGMVAHAGTHKEYLAIPYATVVKRFQAPGPEPTWSSIFDAVDENIRCKQPLSIGASTIIGQEDCLALNVYTPFDASPNKPLPVMLYIHGGGFFQNSGSRSVYGPEFLVSKGVVLVTINYRLNIQGYVCLGIKEAPGNAGMKDQVAALRWTQKNIRAFGGDPDHVTIFGESAGAASVSYHVLSPMSKGLFHKAIIQSGSALSAWAFQYKPIYMASLLAKAMGFPSMDPKALYNFFMTKTDEELISTRVPREEGSTIVTEMIYSPCVEKDFEGEEKFLDKLPYDILAQGSYNKVPTMIGSNAEEGLLFTSMESEDYIKSMILERTFPKDIDFPSNEIRKEEAKKLKDLYFGGEEITLDNTDKLSKIHGEPNFNVPVLEETEFLIKSSGQPVYSYFFVYDGKRNIPKSKVNSELKKVPGATHADDVFYLFNQPIIPSLFGMDMAEKMSTMWSNFAKYGDPTPTGSELLPLRWPVASSDNPVSLLIDEEFSIIPLWHTESLQYWKSLYSKYRRKL